jgi:hypothetical protein
VNPGPPDDPSEQPPYRRYHQANGYARARRHVQLLRAGDRQGRHTQTAPPCPDAVTSSTFDRTAPTPTPSSPASAAAEVGQ